MDTVAKTEGRATPWNKGKLLGQKPPLKLKEIWAIRIRLQLDHRTRDLALFNLAVDSKLRGFDLVALRVHDVVKGRSHGLTSDCHAEENTATSAIRDHRANEGCGSRMDRRRTSKTGAIFVSEPRVSVTSPFDSAVFADCWVVGQLDRFGRGGIRHAFDATYESYDDLSADPKSQSRSVAARAHETRKHS